MGRAFEYRKATKLKRWGHMAKTFTKLGKQIALSLIHISTSAFSATLPVRSGYLLRRSTSMEWLSVPPLTMPVSYTHLSFWFAGNSTLPQLDTLVSKNTSLLFLAISLPPLNTLIEAPEP